MNYDSVIVHGRCDRTVSFKWEESLSTSLIFDILILSLPIYTGILLQMPQSYKTIIVLLFVHNTFIMFQAICVISQLRDEENVNDRAGLLWR